MEDIRSKVQRERAEIYLEYRVRDQRNWYSSRSARNVRRAKTGVIALVGVDGVAVLLGILRIVDVVSFNWLGLLAAGAASIGAWQQIRDYTAQGEAYAVTSYEIGLAEDRVADSAAGDAQTWGEVVDEAEAAFSREHTMWLARRRAKV